jgi:hypothetical protein
MRGLNHPAPALELALNLLHELRQLIGNRVNASSRSCSHAPGAVTILTTSLFRKLTTAGGEPAHHFNRPLQTGRVAPQVQRSPGSR